MQQRETSLRSLALKKSVSIWNYAICVTASSARYRPEKSFQGCAANAVQIAEAFLSRMTALLSTGIKQRTLRIA